MANTTATPYTPQLGGSTNLYNVPAPSGAPYTQPYGPVSGYSAPYGGVPSVPSPISTQQQALQGNLSNLGGLTSLLGPLNTFSGQQAAGQYQSNLPLYNQLTSQASGNILSNLQGQLPQDVINQLSQAAAERGTALGISGSPNSQAALLQALGLNSLSLQNLGQQQLSSAVQRTPVGQLINPQSMLVAPSDVQSASLLSNYLGAAPIPSAVAAANMAALGGGLRQGQGSGYVPSQASDQVASLINKYAPTGGTRSPAYPGQPNPNATASTYSLPQDVANLSPEDQQAFFDYQALNPGATLQDFQDFQSGGGVGSLADYVNPDFSESDFYPTD